MEKNTAVQQPAAMKKYLRKSEPITYALSLFGLAMITGWVQGYSKTFFIDFALGDSGLPTPAITAIVAALFFVARVISAVCDIGIGYQIDRTIQTGVNFVRGFSIHLYRSSFQLFYFSFLREPEM